MALGHEPGEAADAPFNMAVMGLRLAGRSNGVSRLHGATSRRMSLDALTPRSVPDGDGIKRSRKERAGTGGPVRVARAWVP